jgi:hypothetical protein
MPHPSKDIERPDASMSGGEINHLYILILKFEIEINSQNILVFQVGRCIYIQNIVMCQLGDDINIFEALIFLLGRDFGTRDIPNVPILKRHRYLKGFDIQTRNKDRGSSRSDILT